MERRDGESGEWGETTGAEVSANRERSCIRWKRSVVGSPCKDLSPLPFPPTSSIGKRQRGAKKGAEGAAGREVGSGFRAAGIQCGCGKGKGCRAPQTGPSWGLRSWLAEAEETSIM